MRSIEVEVEYPYETRCSKKFVDSRRGGQRVEIGTTINFDHNHKFMLVTKEIFEALKKGEIVDIVANAPKAIYPKQCWES